MYGLTPNVWTFSKSIANRNMSEEQKLSVGALSA